MPYRSPIEIGELSGMDRERFDRIVEELERKTLEDAREKYTEKTLEEAYNPKNVGEIRGADGIGRITGSCGDTMQIHLKVQGDRIVDCKFLTDGCGSSIACGSVITEMVKGKSVGEASRVEGRDVLSILGGLPEESLHCSFLAAKTLKAAIQDYKGKGGIDR
jgi:nitrogen fixation NifU-like protein